MGEQNYTSFDGVIMHYDAVDRGRSKWIIFIHGFGGDHTAWTDERAYFHARGISTVALDLRGHGLSARGSKKSFYALEHFSHDIDALMKHLGIPRAIIVGHCLGGMVSMHFASQYPDRVAALVLVNTGVKVPIIGGHKTAKKLVSRILEFLAHAPDVRMKGYPDYHGFIGTIDVDMRRIFSDIVHTSLRSYLLAFSALVTYDLDYCLGGIHASTLVIGGTKDSVYPPDIAVYLSKHIYHAELDLIEGANHVIVINNPDDVNKSIESFFVRHGMMEVPKK